QKAANGRAANNSGASVGFMGAGCSGSRGGATGGGRDGPESDEGLQSTCRGDAARSLKGKRRARTRSLHGRVARGVERARRPDRERPLRSILTRPVRASGAGEDARRTRES